jgi:hypothetical protein
LDEIGTVLGVSADTARKRVTRALEKLRKLFARRGIVLTATMIAGAVSANSAQAAPPSIVTNVLAATTQTTSPAVASIVKGTTNLLTWTKIKIAALTTGALLGAGTAAFTVGAVMFQPKADGYIVTGDVTYELFDYTNKIHSTFEIEVALGGRQWQMRTESDRVNAFWIYRYDGENMLWYVQTKDKQSKAVPGAMLENFPVPREGSDYGCVVWLAYASGYYLGGRTNDDVYQFRDIRNRSTITRIKEPAQWEYLPGSPLLPRHFEFHATAAHTLDANGALLSRNYDPPFDKGFCSAMFDVLTTTNVDNLTLPLTFEYKLFLPKPESPTSNAPHLAGRVTAIASRIKKAYVKLDPLPQRFYIQDMRIVPNASYVNTTPTLPTMKELQTLGSTGGKKHIH